MKTKEELEKLKEEYTELNKKLSELTEDELKIVSGGWKFGGCSVRYSTTVTTCDYWNRGQNLECIDCPKNK